jgi:hypothetical protein
VFLPPLCLVFYKIKNVRTLSGVHSLYLFCTAYNWKSLTFCTRTIIKQKAYASLKTTMKEDAIRFITEIVKPWETLNNELSKAFSMNPEINDFTTRANSLAVSIKHIAEACQKIKPEVLIPECRPYEIISDLADSSKHGELRKPERECKLSVSSMFERNDDARVRFLRNLISINHNTYGKIDFMQCSMESALFVSQKLNIKPNWIPKIFNNSGVFSDEIRVHASPKQQIVWTGMQLQFVQLNANGEYENVDLNGQVKFVLTSEF